MASGARAAIPSATSGGRSDGGCRTGTPRSRAHTATGGEVSARPRPAGRSGWVTTAATS